MPSRNSQASLAAGYQLMANYLVWDIHDLLNLGQIRADDARGRMRQLLEMLQAAQRATQPVYSAEPERMSAGYAREERGRRLASLPRDEQLLKMVAVARGAGGVDETGEWARQAYTIIKSVQDHEWAKPSDPDNESFIKDDLEPFLRRLGKIDQIEEYQPIWRSGLTRR
jgi:hypothetical protein